LIFLGAALAGFLPPDFLAPFFLAGGFLAADFLAPGFLAALFPFLAGAFFFAGLRASSPWDWGQL
jgi:hypothetical protein